MAVRKKHLPEPEELFLDYVKRMARHRGGREVLLVHMSELEAINRTRHHVELVTTRLEQVAGKFKGRVFRFVNDDIACVLRKASPGFIDNLMFDIRYGFSTDLLVQAEDAGDGIFIDRFDVRWDYDVVEKLAKDRLASYQEALTASLAETEGAGEGRSRPSLLSRETAPDRGSDKTVSGKGSDHKSQTGTATGARTAAGLYEVDSSKRGHGSTQVRAQDRAQESQIIAGPLDLWLTENAVKTGGTMLLLGEVMRPLPVYEIGQLPGEPPVGATLQINPRDLTDAYARANGMKMSERLEAFLLEEAEMSLVPLLGSLVSSAGTSDVSAESTLWRSICLSPSVVLSPAFLLSARAWQEQQDERALFWFEPDHLEQDPAAMSYIADFLHEMGHFVGFRGLVLGDLGTCAASLPQIDGWALRWPELDLARTPKGETDNLSRALEKWGPDFCLLQGINSEDKADAARDFGFRYAECVDVASVKFFSRSF